VHEVNPSLDVIGLTETHPCRFPGCDREFATTRARADHVIAHHAQEPSEWFDCRAEGCTKHFPTRARRDAHEDVGHRRGNSTPRQEEPGMDEITERCWCGRPVRHRGVHKGQKAGHKAAAPDVGLPPLGERSRGPRHPQVPATNGTVPIPAADAAWLSELVSDAARASGLTLQDTPEDLRMQARRLELLATLKEASA
jgi:hypothetical protein